jgi:type I restriction enzyme R subunit
MTTPGRKALYDNLSQDEAAAVAVEEAIRSTAQTGWRGNKMKERMLRRKLQEILDTDDAVDSIIEIIRSHDEY